MIKSVLTNSIIFAILIFSFLVKSTFAESNINIAIFPFSIYANQGQGQDQNQEKKNEQIRTKIPLMISEKLEIEGAKVNFVKDKIDNELNYSEFREKGIMLGVDYLIIGSVFIEGESISVDARMINVFEKDSFTTFYSQADSFENLYMPVSQLSKEIIGELFEKKIITDIAIVGNKRIETDVIMRNLDTQTGDIIRNDNISKDIRNIYSMGYFNNIIVKKESLDKGVKIIFELQEKSTVRKIKFQDNTVFKDDELSDIVDTRTGAILNINNLNSDMNRMRLMYTEKNYHNCSVSYEIIPLDNSQADIVFIFKEGEKLKVEKITFEGNKYFSDDDIKGIIDTSEKGFFSIITSSGDLDETEVKNDAIRIESLYKNNGFIDAKVSDPIIDIGDKLISIRFEINEGAQYKINKIDIKGDLILPEATILGLIRAKEGELYSREAIRNDILSISDAYSDQGFANVNIRPVIEKGDKSHSMAVTYSIDKGEAVYFNRIYITGNSKTRDKVIRRELAVIEHDLYSKANIQRSFRNLNRLDFFEGIDIQPSKTSDENIMDLNVKVIEKQTGNLSFGGGYSSDDGAFVSASVEERNLFGNGQNLKLSANIGRENVLYNISFFEPYIFDTYVSGGFDFYKHNKEYDYYDKEALGIRLRLGYRLFDYTRIGAHYNLENFDITNVHSEFTYMTPGSFLTSSIMPFIQYDSRDDFFLTTDGSKHRFSIEYAGRFLGGEIEYTKYLVETGVFFPIFWKFTGALHAEAGYVDDRTGNTIDIDYVKFYLGGMNSIRGFETYDIHAGEEGSFVKRGGEQYVQFNAELTWPFAEKYRVAGVLFYDRGDVYRKSQSINLGDQYSSFGTGVRWNSPMGPIRLEYAWVIDGKDVKKSGDGQFEFAIGAFF